MCLHMVAPQTGWLKTCLRLDAPDLDARGTCSPQCVLACPGPAPSRDPEQKLPSSESVLGSADIPGLWLDPPLRPSRLSMSGQQSFHLGPT